MGIASTAIAVVAEGLFQQRGRLASYPRSTEADWTSISGNGGCWSAGWIDTVREYTLIQEPAGPFGKWSIERASRPAAERGGSLRILHRAHRSPWS